MPKKIMLLLLTAGLLLSTLPAAHASGLGQAELYATLQTELHRCLNGESNALSPAILAENFESLGRYMKSTQFSYYTAILRDTEAGDTTQLAVYTRLLRMDADFCAMLPEEGFPTVDEVEAYALGRQAEAEGDWNTAIKYYEQSIEVTDSMMRVAKLLLADPTATPTPRPTATPRPTPKPTATPKPTVTPSPTPSPSPTPISSDGYYHYQLFRYYCLNHGNFRERMNGNTLVMMQRNSRNEATDPAVATLRRFIVGSAEWEDRSTRYSSYYDAVSAVLPYLDDGDCHWVRAWIYVMSPTPLQEEKSSFEEVEFGSLFHYEGANWQGKCIKTPTQATPTGYLDDTGPYARLFQASPDMMTFGGHLYQVFWGAASTLDEAAEFCRQQGGYLAVISSDVENAFVYGLMKSHCCYQAFFGLSDSKQEGKWVWYGSEQPSYTNWHDGEPNGGSGENDGMFYDTMYDGTWNDGLFLPGNAFICEWGR